MKIFLIVFLVVDLLLVSAAVLRFATAQPTSEPFVSFGTSADASASFGETGTSGAFVEEMRGRRSGEMEDTAGISTGSPNGNAEGSATGSIERASAIEDNRENDLDDAKSKIGKIGK